MTVAASSSTSPSSTAGLETVAFALIGAAVELPRCLPRVVNQHLTRRRAHVEQQITLARFLGKMAVSHAQSEIRRRMTSSSEATTSPATPGEGEPVVTTPTVTPNQAAKTWSMPIEHYDELSASQVLQRLVHLDSSQLGTVFDYESAHRRRRTVLGRLEQLQAARSSNQGG